MHFAHLDLSGLTQISLFTLSTTPATDASSFPSTVYVPCPLQKNSILNSYPDTEASGNEQLVACRQLGAYLINPVSVVITSPGATKCNCLFCSSPESSSLERFASPASMSIFLPRVRKYTGKCGSTRSLDFSFGPRRIRLGTRLRKFKWTSPSFLTQSLTLRSG